MVVNVICFFFLRLFCVAGSWRFDVCPQAVVVVTVAVAVAAAVVVVAMTVAIAIAIVMVIVIVRLIGRVIVTVRALVIVKQKNSKSNSARTRHGSSDINSKSSL